MSEERQTGVWNVTVKQIAPLRWSWTLAQWVRHTYPGEPPSSKTTLVVTAYGDTFTRRGARREALRQARWQERKRNSVETWEVEQRDG